MQTIEVTASIRELVVQLIRGNRSQAESIVKALALVLNDILKSENDPGGAQIRRAQQTFFAIEETRLMLAQQDFNAAIAAARDAVKEWK